MAVVCKIMFMRFNVLCCLDCFTNIKNLQSNIDEQYFYETKGQRGELGRGGEEEEEEEKREVEIVSLEII